MMGAFVIFPLWKRYIFWGVFRSFFLFSLLTFFLYSVVDYSLNTGFLSSLSSLELLQYYGDQFIKRSLILLPLALLLATLKVLCQMNVNRETTTLFVSGISFTKLLQPFLLMASLVALLLLSCMQWVYPVSMARLQAFEAGLSSPSSPLDEKGGLESLALKDGSKLLYQVYDRRQGAFFDTFWIQGPDSLLWAKYLYPNPGAVPTGDFVEVFRRNSEGTLLLTEEHRHMLFSEMAFQEDRLAAILVRPSDQSLGDLWRFLPSTLSNPQGARIASAFFYKIAMSFAGFLLVLGVAPYCVNYGRSLQIFFIFVGALSTFILFFMVMGTALLLGESNILRPSLALGVPYTLFLLLCLVKPTVQKLSTLKLRFSK